MYERLVSSDNSCHDRIEIPKCAQGRVRTDEKFLLALKVALLVLLPFVIYTLCYSDADRSLSDQCGNICGKKNIKYDQWECTGKDYTNKKLLQLDDVNGLRDISSTPRHCVSQCDPYYDEIVGALCVNRYAEKADVKIVLEFFESWIFLQSVSWRLTFACFLSVGVTLSVLYLFRVAADNMVWNILGGVVSLLFIFVIFLWISCFKEDYVAVPLFFTIMLGVLLAVMKFLYKKITLMVVIFKEAMKAISAMPHLLRVIIVAFIVDLLVASLFLTVLVYMYTAGTLTEIEHGFLVYKSNVVMSFSIYFTILMAFWINQFSAGIQCMAIAGAVSKWYFAKDKNNLNPSIITSAYIAVKFHLGSAAFGSLVISIVAIIQSILSSVFKNSILKNCLNLCLEVIEDILQYLTTNAYIMTAMHGKPFFESGKMGTKMLRQNVANVFVLHYIGSFIIVMACVLVMLISLLLTYFVMMGVNSPHGWSVYAVVGIVSFIVSAVCFSIFQIVIDTIYLCFCEDKLLNDGIDRPYAMSRDLMEFIENHKKRGLFGERITDTYMEI
ncbi:choline transporter-like protein 1 isoform X2 [Anoplophora glabripennis]|nr:choline transporter-like protein 1 isoform X2 [Anoplophora glabripennis]